jgi:hypothetical protein
LGVKSFPSPFLALPLKPCKFIMIQNYIPCTKTLVFNSVLFLGSFYYNLTQYMTKSLILNMYST